MKKKEDLETSDESEMAICELFPWVLPHQKKQAGPSERELLDSICLLNLHCGDSVDGETQSKLSL